jgi:hypothetical protein
MNKRWLGASLALALLLASCGDAPTQGPSGFAERNHPERMD